MMKGLLWGATMSAIAVAPVAAQVAQRPAASLSALAPSRWEIGAQAGPSLFSDGSLLGGGVRLTLNLSRVNALEVVTDVVAGIEEPGINGLYGVQYKRLLRSRMRGRNALFATVTAGSTFRYFRSAEEREVRSDGSIVVFPAYRLFSTRGPLLVGGGIGIERVMGRYGALRVDLQGVVGGGAGGLRAVGGVTIPVGGYDARVQ